MNNWPIIICVSLMLGGCMLSEKWQYRSHLTRAEKATLARGEVLEKNHKAYKTVWKSYYDEGPLRVTPVGKGEYQFQAHGQWRRIDRKGRRLADFNPSKSWRESYWHEYFPDGTPDYVTYTRPTVLEGDSVEETRWVWFKHASPTDTAYVEHVFYKGEQELIKKNYLSYDAQGKQRIPSLVRPSR